MAYICSLQHLNKHDILTAGGKGANLGEMAAAGLPVPTGFVLTTEAYHAFVKEHGLQQQIIDLAANVSAEDPQSSAEASAAIRALFLEVNLPKAVQADLFAAYIDLVTAEETAVAVRSSATAEDLPQASFAGQQETFLNVHGKEGLLEAVKACWASLWTARALAYRERIGIDQETVGMAVVVQVMVPAAVSGILFTANPATGARDELIINASFGLGEAIVSGQVTPDTYVLSRESRTVKETTLGTKEVMIVASDDQRTIIRPVPEAQRTQSALSSDLLNELTTLAAQVEKLFHGVPQDIEWAVAENHCWLLQARPITNLPPAPLQDVHWEPLRPGSIWMRRQVVEHMPEPLSPLFDELYLQEGLNQSLYEMASFMSDLSGFKFDMWDFIEPPFAATINGYAYSIASWDFQWKLIPLVIQVYTVALPKMIRNLFPYWQDQALPAYQNTIAQWKNIDLANAPDEELIRGIRELAAADAVYWFASAVPLGLARITDAVLDHFLKSIASEHGLMNGPHLTSGAYLRGFPSKTVAAQAQLEAIASTIHSSDDLREQVVNAPAVQLPILLAAHPDGQDILNDLQQYLDQYGHQIYNLDFAAPTQADDPLPVLLGLKVAVAHPERDAHTHQAKLAQEREALVIRTEQSLGPIQRRIFQLLLGWAQRYAPYREEALFYVGAAWPTLRRLALELGQRLAQVGSLDAPDDVFYLKSAELASACSVRADGIGRPELAKLAQERRVLRDGRKRLVPPTVVPPNGRLKFGPIDMSMFEPQPRKANIGPTLQGFAVSPGQVIAPASVIHSPEDFDKMAMDTILVCTTTTPAWTPLFAQAKGLVTDIGGALAHGSIVAREYGIPAVMGTGMATQRIKNGQLIQVDGNTGLVTLLDEVNPAVEREDDTQSLVVHTTSRISRKKLFALAALAAGLVVWYRKHRRNLSNRHT